MPLCEVTAWILHMGVIQRPYARFILIIIIIIIIIIIMIIMNHCDCFQDGDVKMNFSMHIFSVIYPKVPAIKCQIPIYICCNGVQADILKLRKVFISKVFIPKGHLKIVFWMVTIPKIFILKGCYSEIRENELWNKNLRNNDDSG